MNFKKKAVKIASPHIGMDCSDEVLSLADEIEAALIKAYNEAINKSLDSIDDWWVIYKKIQGKSKLGEKDGLYRMFAAEDIAKTLENLKIKEKSK